MQNFGSRFLICNLILIALTGILVCAKRLLKNQLSPGLQYYLCIPYFILLSVPFLPLSFFGFSFPVSRKLIVPMAFCFYKQPAAGFRAKPPWHFLYDSLGFQLRNPGFCSLCKFCSSRTLESYTSFVLDYRCCHNPAFIFPYYMEVP